MDNLLADGALLACLVLALLFGWQNGMIKVLAGVGSLVLAYQVARSWSGLIAQTLTASVDLLSPSSSNGQMANFLSLFIDTGALANWLVELVLFIIIFILVRWLVRALAKVLTGVLGGSLLGKINRALGAVLAVVLMAALILIAIEIVLPAASRMGLGSGVLFFLSGSRWILPYLYGLEALL